MLPHNAGKHLPGYVVLFQKPTTLISNVMSILNLFFYTVVMNMASNTFQLSYRKIWVTTPIYHLLSMGWLEVLEKSSVLDKQLQHIYRDHSKPLSLMIHSFIHSFIPLACA